VFPVAGQNSLLIDASNTKLRGINNISVDDLYPTFQIEVDIGSGEPLHGQLEYTGKQVFPVSSDSVVRISYNDLKKTDRFVLWPLAEERAPQSPISNPFTKFELMTFEQIREYLKKRLSNEARRGAFHVSDRLLKNVFDLYEDSENDPAARIELRAWFYQLYQTLSDAARAYREQPAFRRDPNRTGLIDLERGWHRWMIEFNKQIVETGTEEKANVRLAYALRSWADFAAAVYTTDSVWPEDCLTDAKSKGLIKTAYETALAEDLKLVQKALLSGAIEPVLTPKIANNLSPTLTSPPSKTEKDYLISYQQLISASKESGFSLAAFGLSKIDKAISGFNFFYHGEK
jgi:hypothetical protein